MTIEAINAAILAHQTWVARFQTVLKGINTEAFDIGKAEDDAACALGRWLQSEQSLALLGQDSHNQIKVIHGTFHEIAGNIAARLNHHESGKEIEEWLVEFNNLSRQLIVLLMHAKKRM
jgi:hypothetical protein